MGARDEPRGTAIITSHGPSDTVLVVDDEVGVRELLGRWLQVLGFSVLEAGSADEALAIVRDQPIGVALCDIRMPGRDGLWLAEQLRRVSCDTAIVMATGVQDVGSAVASLRQGAIDYLLKPFGRDRLREAVMRGLEWHRAAVDARQSSDRRGAEAQERHRRLTEALAALKIESRESLEAMLSMLSLQDAGMLDHCRRVAGHAVATARLLGLDGDEVDVLERAALVHEVEKLALPETVVHKDGPLTAAELDVVRTAPLIGYGLLQKVPYLARAAELLRARYERWDGSGYPAGLRGTSIPLGSRILAVADTFETMTQRRRGQPALPPPDALGELERCSGTQFDPAVVGAFRRAIGAWPLQSR